MSLAEQVTVKVQRMLANRFGSVRVDKDGDFVVTWESAVVFVRAREWGNDQAVVSIRCPLVMDVPMTEALCRWVAVEGQHFVLGRTRLNPSQDGNTAWIYFENTILADDLDESELMESLDAVVITSNKLDNELQTKFGGTLFGDDD